MLESPPIDSLSADGEIDQEWRTFIAAKRESELDAIIQDENLRPDETRVFVETAFRDGQIRTTGTAIVKLCAFFDRFFGLSS